MNEIICDQCGKPYLPSEVQSVSPLPDKHCFKCMSALSDAEVEQLKARDMPPAFLFQSNDFAKD